MRFSMLLVSLSFFAWTLPAQTNPNASQQRLVSAGYTAKSGSIVETGMLSLEGREINTADSLIKCHGDCKVTIRNVILKADELDFHPKTGEVEARGNVRVKVVPYTAATQ